MRVTMPAAPLRDSGGARDAQVLREAVLPSRVPINLLLLAAMPALLAGVARAQSVPPAEVPDAVCASCHAEPGTKFHSQPSHKKLACASCHAGGPAHVADPRARPKLGGNPQLCASCHEAKKRHGSPN